MPLYLTTPADDPTQTVLALKESTPRLDGIMSALRGECLQVVSAVYRELPTKETPVLTDLLHGFQEGDREELSDLRLDFPEIPEESFGASPEQNTIGSPGEDRALYEQRIHAGCKLANQLGSRVLVVAPASVLQTLAGVTLKPGEVYAYSDDTEYYARCLLELSTWRESTSS